MKTEMETVYGVSEASFAAVLYWRRTGGTAIITADNIEKVRKMVLDDHWVKCQKDSMQSRCLGRMYLLSIPKNSV